MTDRIDTDDLRRIVGAATKGPWQPGEMVSTMVFAWHLPPDAPDAVICSASEANARLIALAPDLASELLASRAREADLRAALTQINVGDGWAAQIARTALSQPDGGEGA